MNVAYLQDCMDAMREMKDKEFDLAIVDPVYGDVTQGGYMKNQAGNKAKANDFHTGIWHQKKTGGEYFRELMRVSKNQVIWGGNYFSKEIGQDSQCWLVWDKKNDGSRYADVELAWTSFNQAARIFRFRWNGYLQENMKDKENRIHPTQKPVALYKWILSRYAEKGMKILDTHLGSGSSRIAAYDMGLDFVGYEIDPVYFQKQEERFARHTAQLNMFIDLGVEDGQQHFTA